MQLQAIEYRHGASTFVGYLADGSSGERVPGILVGHEGPGLVEHTKARTRMLAELGCVAFAMDLYGVVEPSLDEAKGFVRALRDDPDTLRGRARAAFDVLVGHPSVDVRRVAAVGFCFGGMAVLELARSGAGLAGVVGFHAALTTKAPAASGAIRGKILVCLGADDPIVDEAQRSAFRAEMSAARVDWQMMLYGGVGHSFTNPDIGALNVPGFAYDAVADRRSWQVMREFFAEVLGPMKPECA